MTRKYETLAARITERLGERVRAVENTGTGLCYEVESDALLEVCEILRDEPDLGFEMLMDLCGVDYLSYGDAEWDTDTVTATGFSRGVTRDAGASDDVRRFAVAYQLLSIKHNWRLRLRAFCADDNAPILSSVIDIWQTADWFEREAFDLFGILFEGHPDLRRILTDYGFIGHPFRKDFPLIGNVEVRYDPDKGRVVYQPVSIEPRTLVPRVIRDDNRYEPVLKEPPGDA